MSCSNVVFKPMELDYCTQIIYTRIKSAMLLIINFHTCFAHLPYFVYGTLKHTSRTLQTASEAADAETRRHFSSHSERFSVGGMGTCTRSSFTTLQQEDNKFCFSCSLQSNNLIKKLLNMNFHDFVTFLNYIAVCYLQGTLIRDTFP